MRNSPPDGAEVRCAEHQIRVRCPALAIRRKFSRLNEEAQELLQDLKERHSSKKPLHEVEVIHKALDGAMDDLKSLVDRKADTVNDDGTREAILPVSQFQLTKSQYYAEAALAKSYISTVKATMEQDKQAGCLRVVYLHLYFMEIK